MPVHAFFMRVVVRTYLSLLYVFYEHNMYLHVRLCRANSAFHPSGVGKWVPASAGKAKTGMVHSVSGWTRGVQVKLRSLENACHTWALQRCVHDEALCKYTFTFTFSFTCCRRACLLHTPRVMRPHVSRKNAASSNSTSSATHWTPTPVIRSCCGLLVSKMSSRISCHACQRNTSLALSSTRKSAVISLLISHVLQTQLVTCCHLVCVF